MKLRVGIFRQFLDQASTRQWLALLLSNVLQ